MEGSFRFGTVGSPLATPKKPGGSIGAIQYSAELGLYALELGWVQSVRVSEATCQSIHQACSQFDVVVSVHAPYFINLNADDNEWPNSRKRLMDAAYYGFLAGATDIIFHPGSYFGAPAREVLPKAIQRLANCREELNSLGNPVTVRPETMGKSAMLGSFEDVIQFCKSIPGVEPCLDFAHLHARPGDGSMNTYSEWCSLLETLAKELGEQALSRMHIHLSGIEYSLKGERNHLPLAEADLDLQAIFTALHDFDCRGRILCESPEMEADALKMKELWTRLYS